MGKLSKGEYSAGPESEEVKLFSESEIPWNDIAFSVIEKTLKHKVSLRDYIIDQINLNFKNSHSKTVAIGMIDYLHPSGWFISSTCEVAKELNVDISSQI